MTKTSEINSPYSPKPSALLIFEKQAERPLNNDDPRGDYPSLLSESLSETFGSVQIASTSEEIWEALFKEIPAVIVIELTMKSLDALGFIRSLRSSKFCFDIRYFICCDKITDSVKSICRQNKLDGAFLYAENVEAVSKRIIDSYLELSSTSAERRLNSISQMLQDSMYFSDSRPVWELGSRITDALLVPLGFNTEHKGTRYLEFVICMRVFGAQMDMNMLYELAAECYFTTPAAVEKTIRYAIERAWSGSSPYMQYRIFGNSIDAEKGKPTASEFVETIVRHTVERLCGVVNYSDL